MAGNLEVGGYLVETEVINQRATSPTVLGQSVRAFSSDEVYSGELVVFSFSYLFVKRLVDFGISSILLLLLSPFFLVIALVVCLSSPGPIIYREWRVGRFGRRLQIYKFRSMYTKAYLRDVSKYQEDENLQMRLRIEKKYACDPRVTKVGSLLRRLSLDEFPQLINILKGDMSLIGPRPVVDAELSRYGEYARLYKLMYPGLSGLWQVSGRSDVSYQQRVLLDVAYCKEWSPLLDTIILVRTIPAVFQGKGAY